MVLDGELPSLPAEAVLRPKDRVSVSLPCRVRQAGTGFIKSEAVLVSRAARGYQEAA